MTDIPGYDEWKTRSDRDERMRSALAGRRVEPDDEDARADARVLAEAGLGRGGRYMDEQIQKDIDFLQMEIAEEHGIDYLSKVLRLARHMREEA